MLREKLKITITNTLYPCIFFQIIVNVNIPVVSYNLITCVVVSGSRAVVHRKSSLAFTPEEEPLDLSVS